MYVTCCVDVMSGQIRTKQHVCFNVVVMIDIIFNTYLTSNIQVKAWFFASVFVLIVMIKSNTHTTNLINNEFTCGW